MNLPGDISGTLTDEQKKRIEAATSPEELISLAKEAGYELSEDQLEDVAGGKSWCHVWCGKPYCNLDHSCTYIHD